MLPINLLNIYQIPTTFIRGKFTFSSRPRHKQDDQKRNITHILETARQEAAP